MVESKITISKKDAIVFLFFVITFSLIIGYFSGTRIGTALGGEEEKGNHTNSALRIQEFVEKEVAKGIDLKKIEKEAKKLGKKHRLEVAFVGGYKSTTVNIFLNLGNKFPIILSFEIEGGK